MSEGSPLSSLARLGAFAVLPAGAVLILVGLVSIESTDGTLIRFANALLTSCLLYTSPSPRDLSTSRMPSSA